MRLIYYPPTPSIVVVCHRCEGSVVVDPTVFVVGVGSGRGRCFDVATITFGRCGFAIITLISGVFATIAIAVGRIASGF